MEFTLEVSNIRFWNPVEQEWVIDPGEFDLWSGNSSLANLHTTFTVGGDPRPAR